MDDETVEARITFPSDSYELALRRVGEALGVQDVYWDIWGKEHRPEAAIQQSVLRSMGVDDSTTESLDAAYREILAHGRLAILPLCTVSSEAEPWVPVGFGRGVDWPLRLIVTDESGRTWERTARTSELELMDEVIIGGARFDRAKFPLPDGLGLGYHRAKLQTPDGRPAEGSLIHCPDKTYFPPALQGEARVAGIAISLYGLRSNRNWGCGDLTDLQHFAQWARRETGSAFIALNPLHAIANRSPYNTSPYLPESTYYRNYLYVDVEAAPEFAESALAQRLRSLADATLGELRATEYVDYERVSRIKRVFLQVLYRQFLRGRPERRREFDEFRKREGKLLERFATYNALYESLHRRNPNLWIWPDWPEQYRDPESPAVADFERRNWRRVEFWQFTYWLVDQQVAQAQRAATEAGMPIGLYHDLALATDRCGSDLWGHRAFYVDGCRVGSPPDEFSPKGQDWSFPPPNVKRHREDGYRMFAAAIRNTARHGGALRIDHVMRFFRLYWIPEGRTAAEGTFVREQWKDLLRILALESHRNGVFVVGEDLGTVEDYVRKGLEEFGVLSYRLLYFERTAEGKFRRPDDYPFDAVVSSTTHDLPTLAGWWLGRDIEARKAAGLLPDEESYRDQLRSRLEDKHKLIEILHDLHLLPDGYPRDAAMSAELTGDLHNAVIGFLASASSRVFVINQEDLTKETEQQNLPGSTWEYPNWKRKMKYSLEELDESPIIHDFTAMLQNWLRATGRLQA